MVVDMESFRDTHWDRSHLVHMAELRYDPTMVGHMVVEVESLRYLDWYIDWENGLDIHWEAPLK